jgi:hypothetical protein
MRREKAAVAVPSGYDSQILIAEVEKTGYTAAVRPRSPEPATDDPELTSLAGAAMALSSLFVVGNSLRLRSFTSVMTPEPDQAGGAHIAVRPAETLDRGAARVWDSGSEHRVRKTPTGRLIITSTSRSDSI